jgi:hypothetical protein
MMSDQEAQGKFIAMPYIDDARHEVSLPRFPIIDYHNHLDAQDPRQVREIMDACGASASVGYRSPSPRITLCLIRSPSGLVS